VTRRSGLRLLPERTETVVIAHRGAAEGAADSATLVDSYPILRLRARPSLEQAEETEKKKAADYVHHVLPPCSGYFVESADLRRQVRRRGQCCPAPPRLSVSLLNLAVDTGEVQTHLYRDRLAVAQRREQLRRSVPTQAAGVELLRRRHEPSQLRTLLVGDRYDQRFLRRGEPRANVRVLITNNRRLVLSHLSLTLSEGATLMLLNHYL
jgi:hypothetical protein